MAPTTTEEVVPFRVAFDPNAVDDLRRRLQNTRWPDRETVDDWSQGVPLAFVQDLAAYWCDEYDFETAEERINAWPQFTTRIDDLDIHFVHARSPESRALPIVITHGWPGTYVEFLEVIGLLTDPVAHGGAAADAFHVVCPSLPGFGFSSKPTTRGRGVPWIGDAWATLMARLEYERYGAQGGDWGAAVTNYLGETHRDHVVGIHVNMPLAPLGSVTDEATDFERRSHEDFEWHQRWGTGYQHQQSSRPQTLGYALVDSPAGQLAWIVEKFWAWTDCDGDPYAIFTREQLLDNVTIYWFTASGASSGRLYWESASTDPALIATIAGPITVPAGCSVFPREIRRPSRRWAEQVYTNLHYWNHPERGGHFAAFEQPELFVEEVRSSFRPLR